MTLSSKDVSGEGLVSYSFHSGIKKPLPPTCNTAVLRSLHVELEEPMFTSVQVAIFVAVHGSKVKLVLITTWRLAVVHLQQGALAIAAGNHNEEPGQEETQE